jgi:hypothetical protein
MLSSAHANPNPTLDGDRQLIGGLVTTVPTNAPLSSWVERVRPGAWIVEIAWQPSSKMTRLGLRRAVLRLVDSERRVRFALDAGAWGLEQWPAPDAPDPHVVTLWRHRR